MGLETNSLIDVEYHDNAWTILVHDDNNLFEFLLLQSAQVGISRSTILKKRKAYKKSLQFWWSKNRAIQWRNFSPILS